MLTMRGNTKTGTQVSLFNLPRVVTCPGRTEICDRVCYVKKSARYAATINPALAKRYEASQREDFVAKMCEELQTKRQPILRLHSSGDFYSAAYIRKWIKILQKCPHVTAWTYTRSWRKKRMLKALKDLQSLPNMTLWWSTDRSCEPPPEGLVAYMVEFDNEEVPAFADMVFRVRRNTPMPVQGGIVVCPKEAGTGYKGTCHQCALCWKPEKSLQLK